MMVIFTSQSDKNALKTTRWILDAFASRIGTDTWQTIITEEGLQMVRALLRRHATKSMSVSCRWIRSRTRSQLLWIVGDRSRFNEEGYVPVNSTQRNCQHREWENDWQYLPEIKAIAALSGLLHDWGKASDGFQKALRDKRGQEVCRHEWLSCKLLEALTCLSGGQTDEAWLELLQKGTHKELEKEMIKWLNENVQKSFTAMPPLASMLCWLILSHHRLPGLKDDERNRYKNSEVASYSLLLSQIDAHWGYIKEGEVVKFSKGLRISTAWQKMLKKWCSRLLEQIDVWKRLWEERNIRLLLIYARICLMLADYTVSAGGEDEKWQTDSKLYANTRGKELKQYLDEHLVKVARKAAAVAHSLPRLAESMSRVEDAVRLRGKSPQVFAWRDKVSAKLRDFLQEQEKAEQESGGWFVINMAGTGCGKTFGNAKIMRAIAKDGLRYSLLLGLRSLTLQTGREYRARVGVDDSEMAVLVGAGAVRELYEGEESWENSSDTAHMNELLSGEVHADFPKEDSFLQVLASGKSRDLLYAPLLVATIDHLMPAVETVRGGRHLIPLLRMMSADLVIDEIDDFAGADLTAIARLVHMAGMMGKNVILSSATIPPDLAEGMFSAYWSGRREYARFFGRCRSIECAWCDEFQSKIKHFNADDREKAMGEYRQQHKAFSLRHIEKLKIQPGKRFGYLVPCDALLSEPLGKRLTGYYHAMQQAALQLHSRHAVRDVKTGKNVSIGLLRLANIGPCVRMAQYLIKTAWPMDVAPRILVYHSRQTAMLRSRQEQYLDKVLKRKGQDGEEFDFEDAVLRRHIERTAAQNVMFILVATPVEEVGRDHDFDWAVVEPSSYRSIIQLAGRVRRHRSPLSKSAGGNIAIMQYNIKSLKGERVAFCKPGFESGKYLLSSHDMSTLVDVQQLAERIDASPRILRPETLQPHDKLIHLEHQVLTDFRDLSCLGAGYLHGWQEEMWWLTALPQSFNKFRDGKPDIELCLMETENGEWAFHEKDVHTGQWKNREYAYGISHEEVEDSERFWLKRDYQDAMARYQEGREGKPFNPRVGLLALLSYDSKGGHQWLYSDQYGMYEED